MAELRVGGATLLPMQMKAEYREVPVGMIDLSSGNIRSVPNDEAQQSLNESFRRDGQMQPALGYLSPDGTKIFLVLGFRRFAAAVAAQLATFKVLLLDHEPDPVELKILQASENLHRKDLSPMEESRTFRFLAEVGRMSFRELGERLNIAHTTIARAIALSSLPDDLQAEIEAGTLSPAHGRALARLPGDGQMREVYGQIRSRGMTAEQAEKLVSSLVAPRKVGKRKAVKSTKPTKRTFSLAGGYVAVVMPKQVLLRCKGPAKAPAKSGDLLGALELLVERLREDLQPQEGPGQSGD